jgi:transposase
MDMTAALALAGEGFSRRKIARMLGVSRNTLKKYLVAPPGNPDAAAGGKLGCYHEILSGALREKPGTRAMEIFHFLKASGYSGSYDLVKRRVRALRRNPGSIVAETKPGLRAKADLGRVTVAGCPLFLFTLSLAYSGRIYAELSARADLDAFLEWHVRAFRYFQGVPREIAYETSSNRWLKAFVGGGPVNLPMARFAGHHGFAVVVTEPAAPWSAGRLKRPLRMIETLFLKGYPFQSTEGANISMLGWLLGREESSPAGSSKDRFEAERDCLAALPKTAFPTIKLKLAGKGESG